MNLTSLSTGHSWDIGPVVLEIRRGAYCRSRSTPAGPDT